MFPLYKKESSLTACPNKKSLEDLCVMKRQKPVADS